MSGRGGVRSSARLSGDAVAAATAAAATAPAAPGPTVRVALGRGRPVATTAAAALRRARAAERAREVEDSPRVLRDKCRRLARALRNAKHLVVYTGAGISTAADIPDYRGPDGVWTRLQRGETVGRVEVSRARPTFTHMALTALWARGALKFVVSQNCDGLHLRAGLPRRALAELHGDMFAELCSSCRRVYLRAFDTTERTARHQHGTRRLCHACGTELRDSIVHFGERGRAAWPLNWAGALRHAARADVVLCLGSSLKVLRRYPRLWRMQSAPRARPALYIVNLQWTPKDSVAALKINARCDAVMQQVARRLRLRVPRYRAGRDPVLAHAEPLAAPEQHTTRRPLLRAPAEPDDSASDEWEPSSPSASDSDEELPLRRLADRLRGPVAGRLHRTTPDRLRGSATDRLHVPSPDRLRGSDSDRLRGPDPDRLRRSEPDRLRKPDPDRLRGPKPDRLHVPDGDRLHRPDPDRLRESDPDRLCGALTERLRGPDADRLRRPNPDHLRESDLDHVRGPDTDSLCRLDTNRLRGPEHDRLHVPDSDGLRGPSSDRLCGSSPARLSGLALNCLRGSAVDRLRGPASDRLHGSAPDRPCRPVPDRLRGLPPERPRVPCAEPNRGPTPIQHRRPVPDLIRRPVPGLYRMLTLDRERKLARDGFRGPTSELHRVSALHRERRHTPDGLHVLAPDGPRGPTTDGLCGLASDNQCGPTSEDPRESIPDGLRESVPDSLPDPAPDRQDCVGLERLRAFQVTLQSGEATILLRAEHAPSPTPPEPSPPRCRTTDLRRFRMARHVSDSRSHGPDQHPLTVNGRGPVSQDPRVSPVSIPDDAKFIPVNGGAPFGSRLRRLLEYEPRINASENAKRPLDNGPKTEFGAIAFKAEVKTELKFEPKIEDKSDLKDEFKREESTSDEERGAMAAGTLAAAIIRRAVLLCRASLYPGLHTIIAQPAPVPRPAAPGGTTNAECNWCARHYSARRCLWYGPPRDPPPSARAWRRVRGRRYLCACCGAGQSPPRQPEPGPDEGGWYGKGYRKGRRRRR